MQVYRRLPFPDLPARKRSRVHWPKILSIVVLGFALMLVIRAVRQPGITAMPQNTAPSLPEKKPLK